MSLHKPEGDVEVQAYKDWTGGQPAKAMQDMRLAGFGQSYRRAWLASVVGLDDAAIGQLELWRDGYLRWLEAANDPDTPTRTAHVPTNRQRVVTAEDAEAKRAEVQKYMPQNYRAETVHYSEGDGWTVVVSGFDLDGWTLEDYVIPRLASGLFTAFDVVECPSCGGWMKPGRRECFFCSV